LDLRDLTLFNRELIESLPSGMFATDLAGRVIIFNKAAQTITGISRTKASGLHLTDIFPFLSSPLETERTEGIIRQNGRDKIIGFGISRTTDSVGQQTGYICIFQDITRLKTLESELKHKETLAAIGELSANMAHEIRNPLASLKGSIEMLKEGTLPQEQSRKLMSVAIGEMDRLNKIITDFLTYSRPKPPEYSWFDLHTMLDETIELVKNALPSIVPVTIEKDFPGLGEICADPHKLRQVFLNLGMNAIEAMPGGGILIIRTRRDDLSVTVSFKDSGVGIPSQNLREVFYPFFTTKDTGTGLGLSIAYRIVEEHNGAITLASKPGEGATFEIRLPLIPKQIPRQGAAV